jgi:hypothetical protein
MAIVGFTPWPARRETSNAGEVGATIGRWTREVLAEREKEKSETNWRGEDEKIRTLWTFHHFYLHCEIVLQNVHQKRFSSTSELLVQLK